LKISQLLAMNWLVDRHDVEANKLFRNSKQKVLSAGYQLQRIHRSVWRQRWGRKLGVIQSGREDVQVATQRSQRYSDWQMSSASFVEVDCTSFFAMNVSLTLNGRYHIFLRSLSSRRGTGEL